MQRACHPSFNSRSPSGERPILLDTLVYFVIVSTHAPRVGSDILRIISSTVSPFQLTLPEWGATRFGWDYNPCQLVSTHAPRVGSDQIRITANVYSHVSTHAPRAGSYSHRDVHPSNAPRFNSRSPSGERRSGGYLTISGWGFNSRSPCGERRWLFIIFIYFIIVSTHAPRAGSDSGSSMMPGSSVVSTHAPRVGSDWHRRNIKGYELRFNSRSPSGERLAYRDPAPRDEPFQLTLPERGATSAVPWKVTSYAFQLTLPERGATRAPR